jgi:hypothetical protein
MRMTMELALEREIKKAIKGFALSGDAPTTAVSKQHVVRRVCYPLRKASGSWSKRRRMGGDRIKLRNRTIPIDPARGCEGDTLGSHT